MRMSDGSSDVCSSDLGYLVIPTGVVFTIPSAMARLVSISVAQSILLSLSRRIRSARARARSASTSTIAISAASIRSEEHTSELQSLMRISYAVFCLKKKQKTNHNHRNTHVHTPFITEHLI